MWSLKKFTSAYLYQIAREKSFDYLLIIHFKTIYYLKPQTIHCLLRHEEGIALDLPKLGKASKMSGDLQRSSEIVTSLRESSEVIFGNHRKYSSDLRKYSGDLRKNLEGYMWSDNLRKVLHDLRNSSKYIGWPPAVFESLFYLRTYSF